jgi:hypothetical protein
MVYYPNFILLFFKAVQTAISALEGGDTMGERMGRIGRIETDFF